MEFFNIEISGELLSAIKPSSHNPASSHNHEELLKRLIPQAPTEKKPDVSTPTPNILNGHSGLPR